MTPWSTPKFIPYISNTANNNGSKRADIRFSNFDGTTQTSLVAGMGFTYSVPPLTDRAVSPNLVTDADFPSGAIYLTVISTD